MKETFRTRAPLLAAAVACFVTALVYLSPQFVHWQYGRSGAAILRDDEAFYAARVRRMDQGYLGVGNPWAYKHRDTPSILPVLPELTLAGVGKLLPIRFESKVIVFRALLAATLYLAFWFFLSQLWGPGFFAAGVAFWILVDPGLTAYKPIIGLFLGGEQLPLNRFSNPLFGLGLFFATLTAVYRAFLPTGTMKYALLAAGLLAAQFYVSVYYWTHTILLIIGVCCISTNPRRWKLFLAGTLATAVLGIPYLLQVLRQEADPLFESIPWRLGLLLKDRGLYLLGHKTLYVFIFLAVLALRRERYADRFLGASVIAGALVYFSPLYLGVSFQNFHLHYTLAPLCFCLALEFLREKLHVPRPVLVAGAVVAAVAGAFAGFTEYRAAEAAEGVPLALDRGAGYREALAWLEKNADKEDVVLAHEHTTRHIPFVSGQRIFYDSVVEYSSAAEILIRNQMLWYFAGKSAQGIRELIENADYSVAQFTPGMTDAQLEKFRATGFPPITHDVVVPLAREIGEFQSTIDVAWMRERIKDFRFDFFLAGANEQGWTEKVAELFELTPVAKFLDTTVYRLKPRP